MKVIPSIDDYLSALSIQLAAQPSWKMSCFNAACAERLVPWYVSECAITTACPDTLREIVDSIWQSIVDEQVDTELVAHRKAILDAIQFDEDPFTITRDGAFAATAAASDALDALCTPSRELCLRGAEHVVESIDSVLMDQIWPYYETGIAPDEMPAVRLRITLSPLMQRELSWLERVQELITESRAPTSERVSRFRYFCK